MKTYTVEIVESSRELTNKERIMFKQGAGAQSLDALTQDGPIEIYPELYALLAIHNEKARDDQDYQQIIVKDKVYPGTKIIISDVSRIMKTQAQYCRFVKSKGDVTIVGML